MHLPSFKRKSSEGPIDVTATPIRSVTPPTIVVDVLPDLGDYSAEYPEALPESAKILPFVTWLAILAAIAWSVLGSMDDNALKEQRRKEQGKLNSAKIAAAELKSTTAGLDGKAVDLQVLSRWASVSYPMRGVAVAAVIAAADRVQIRSLEIKRRDATAIRYTIQLLCSGTRTNFDAMRKTLLERLATDGWAIEEAQAGAEDARLIFEGTLTRKQG